MSNRLTIALATIGIAGSVAGGALAAPYREVGDGRYFSGAYASEQTNDAGYAAGEENESGHDASEPHYHGGPKNPY